MKTRSLIIIGIIVIVSIGSFSVLLQIQLTDVHPCFNKELNHHVPCSPDDSIQFYEYKGEEWMEAKKQEMIATIRNNTFHEWVDQTKDDHSHWNVYMYYSVAEDLTKYTSDPVGYLGCDKPILEHLLKYSNLLDDEFDGNYGIEDIGLPDGVTQEKFDECVDFILEKRISMGVSIRK